MKYQIAAITLLAACGSGELSTNSSPGDDNSNNEVVNNTSSNNTNNANNVNNTSSNNANNDLNNIVLDMGMDSGGSEDVGVDTAPDMMADLGPQFHPMFVAVADFFLEKCVNCHAQGQNGNFAMPQADGTYEQVRVAIDGVASTSGNLIIEPNDPDNSQAFIMMTNDAGEQFDAATIAVVADWINAGAPYFEN